MAGDAQATALSRSDFGALPDGAPVERWQLDDGVVTVGILTYGATLQSLLAPDRHGERADVLLGFDDLAGYLGDQPYLGAVIGRYANRIARGRFPLNGRTNQLINLQARVMLGRFVTEHGHKVRKFDNLTLERTELTVDLD